LPSFPPTSHPAAFYALQFQLAEQSDLSAAVGCWNDIVKVAKERQDDEIYWSARIIQINRCLRERRVDLATPLLDEVANDMWPPSTEQAVATEWTKAPKALRIEFIFLFCLHAPSRGQIKVAKERLKLAHKLLDEHGDGDGQSGLVGLAVRGGGEVVVKVGERESIYAYAFLVSVVRPLSFPKPVDLGF
jgi:hypothetical protein